MGDKARSESVVARVANAGEEEAPQGVIGTEERRGWRVSVTRGTRWAQRAPLPAGGHHWCEGACEVGATGGGVSGGNWIRKREGEGKMEKKRRKEKKKKNHYRHFTHFVRFQFFEEAILLNVFLPR